MSTGTFTREQVEARLQDLGSVQDEINRLERILEVWDGPKKGGRPRGTTATRASRGSRPQQFLEAVQDSPGITASDLASEMSANPNYIYRIAKDFEKEGKIVKTGKGYYLADAETPSQPEHHEDEDEVGETE